jgi:hypothetical protein
MTDSTVSIIDVIIKGIALLSGGVFFIWKALSGYNNQNLSLSLQCSRVAQHSDKEPPDDLVLLTISIEKGTTSALALEGLEARFRWRTAEDQLKVHRVGYLSPGHRPPDTPIPTRHSIVEARHKSAVPVSGPGEKTAFGCSTGVPSAVPCEVDVVAFGRRRKSAFQAQWRASAVVSMLPKTIPTAEKDIEHCV